MKLLFSVTLAASYGLTIRLLFGVLDNVMGIMSASFFFLVPFLIGYHTIILIPYKSNHTSKGAFFKPWLTCLVLFLVTWAFGIEGMICWAMAFPLFATVAGLGGILAYSRKKRRARLKEDWDFDKDDWQKPGGLKVSFLFLIPILMGLLEGDRTSAFKELTVEKHIEVQASPAVVWNALIENRQSAIKSHHATLSNLFGFPHHLTTTLDMPVVGGSRVAAYEKGLTFMETITRIEPRRLLALKIMTDPTRISKAIMDEHIVIGGKHVQLLEDEYKLVELPNGKTQLSLSSRFSINTPFNWYAGLWSKLLMSDILKEELHSIAQISIK